MCGSYWLDLLTFFFKKDTNINLKKMICDMSSLNIYIPSLNGLYFIGSSLSWWLVLFTIQLTDEFIQALVIFLDHLLV